MKNIQPDIIKNLATQTQQELLRILPLMERLERIKSKIKVEELNNNKIKKTENRQALFEAYEIIQKIRFLLTNEELMYHLYVVTQDSAQGIEIGSARLGEFIGYEQSQIRIIESKVKAALQETKLKIKSADLFQAHYQQILNSMKRETRSYTVWRPSEKDRNRYNLYQKKGNQVPQVYNQGHIVEALDAVDQNNRLWRHLFFKELQLDSVSGFKGGDNAMIQVKANHARLMRYSTIINGIDKVLQIKENIQNKKYAETLIKDLFFSNASINQQVEEKIDNFITKLENELSKPLEKV